MNRGEPSADAVPARGWSDRAGSRRFSRIATIVLVSLVCWPTSETTGAPGTRTTYDRFLPLAESGDPEIQNFLGFMLFHGEGVQQNYELAHEWFHRAAVQDHKKAQRNLALMHSGTIARVPAEYLDIHEANKWFGLATGSDVGMQEIGELSALAGERRSMEIDHDQIGERTFRTFCSGCHGATGHAAYDGAPSFALSERLEKEDAVLIQSMLNGYGKMPAWRDTLEPDLLELVLEYIRTLPRFRDLPTRQIAGATDAAQDGDRLYATFCGGCHGFNGIAYYVNSPSFALGERMEKSDQELMAAIAGGIGQMPGWDDKLSDVQLELILETVRSLKTRYEDGIQHPLPEGPNLYFNFRR